MVEYNIIFLDVDGVLNCNATFEKEHPPGTPILDIITSQVEEDKVLLLKEIVELMDARIVVSSTWRQGLEHLDVLTRTLARHGIAVLDKTPTKFSAMRGVEISDWLNRWYDKVRFYIILDDNDEMLDEQLPYFLQTSMETGLTRGHVDSARRLFFQITADPTKDV